MLFKEKLKEFRKSLNLTQAEFATKCELSRTTITELESGRKQPTLKLIEKIASGTNTNINEWLDNLNSSVNVKAFDGLAMVIKRLYENNLIDAEGHITECAKPLLYQMLDVEVQLFVKQLNKK